MAGQESLPLRRLKQFQPLNRLTDDQLVFSQVGRKEEPTARASEW